MLENAVFERGQLDRRAAHLDGLRTRVERNGAASQLGTGPAARASQQRLQARQNLFKVEGLGDVVIGPGLQAFDLVLPIVARRENQDGVALVARPQAADDLEACDLRQAEIDDRNVQGIFESGEQRFLAIRRDIDGEAGVGEPVFQHVAQRSFVFDNQHAHGTVPKSSSLLPHRPGPSTHGRSR